jgi:hypothetical protein
MKRIFSNAKLNVNSFDVFDTLIARNVKCPTDIFDIIEKTCPFPNFKKYRIMSEKENGLTLDSIYNEFQKNTNESNDVIELLKEFEILTEINNSYLIMSNVNLVNDGDILISDMYLSPSQISRILKSLGFTKNVNIYSSSIGLSKSNGTLFEYLLNKYNIILHTGDNEYSDCYMANKYNIPYKLTQLHKFNDTEKFFIDNEKYKNFGFLIRKFRLQNPYPEASKAFFLYNDQAIINIPLLVMLSFNLKEYLIAEKRDTILFSTRDSCLIQPIFNTIFPDISTKTFHTSRIMNNSDNPEYDKYIFNTYNDSTCIIFDGHGSFNSGRKKYMKIFNNLPRIHIFSLAEHNLLLYDKLSYNIKFGNATYELFNVDTIGTLIDFKNKNFIRHDLDGYKIENAEIYKETISTFCKFLKLQDNRYILDIFEKTSSEMINNYYESIYINAKSNIIDNYEMYCNLPSNINFNEKNDIEQKTSVKKLPLVMTFY